MSDLSGPTPPTEDCPTVETLRAFVQGRLAEADLSTVLCHLYVRSCRRCGELLLAMPQTTASVLAPPAGVVTGPDERRTAHDRPAGRGGEGGDAQTFGGLRLGRYAVRELLGKGGFGAVYAAFDDGLRREVAVKVPFECRLATEELGKVRAEAWLHAALDHPNVVPIYDVGETADVPFFFVSKLIRGENLAQRIERSRPGPREAAGLLVPLALALDHMRQRGLVHRDVKPRNVLLDEGGTPYLTDFGLATQPSPAAEGAPERLLLAGTLPYMSPEQASGHVGRVDHRSDVYALGVVLYELLTGERPFRGEAKRVREDIQRRPPVPPRQLAPAVPRDLERICLKALAKAPEQRYQEAGQLAEDLGCWLRGEPPRHVGAARLRRGLWWVRRNRERVGWVALALLALALVGWVATRPTPEPEPAPDRRVAATVRTDPPGASVSYFPLGERTGEPRPDAVVRGKDGEAVRLLPGHYLVVAVSDADPGQFHEVFRVVPGDGRDIRGPFRHQEWRGVDGVTELGKVKLHRLVRPPDMSLFPAAEGFDTFGKVPRVEGGEVVFPKQRRRVPAFLLDTTEVRADGYHRWLKGAVRSEERPVPSPDHPATSMTWDYAAAYAEWAGKRLPDEYEYEYAATACGRFRFPWGDSVEPLRGKGWSFGPVGQPAFDRVQPTPDQPAVFGLYSNVAEWTSSWPGFIPAGGPGVPLWTLRVVRGGPDSVVRGKAQLEREVEGPRRGLNLTGFGVRDEPRPGLGFRCARSAEPRREAKDFGAAVGP
ncbi:MAG: bifunctional serine/threonine-protein kinase/formylglycine-generating enzyme family protein [Gemmataceae bacterium]